MAMDVTGCSVSVYSPVMCGMTKQLQPRWLITVTCLAVEVSAADIIQLSYT